MQYNCSQELTHSSHRLHGLFLACEKNKAEISVHTLSGNIICHVDSFKMITLHNLLEQLLHHGAAARRSILVSFP
jgi:hypothetical protein